MTLPIIIAVVWLAGVWFTHPDRRAARKARRFIRDQERARRARNAPPS
jgi:hypothetical protein